MERCILLHHIPPLDHKIKKGRAMEQVTIFNLLGYIALCAMAFTILIPLGTAIKHCRAEKREKKLHAESTGHSLS